ncbi:DNA (cytosine-5-)-methyltransferase [Floricoccus tropicus]|uniref:Cytosine-specific methyltransferase n=1 Tax=Floricoccus tropicus TaxID=1859473 RepID=A0A1E8GJU2_9LACT|nr:DNA cytosine methyltransferase [Floricoccus tropicus]OFI48525.1 DNA (cytosine-5-)-methyltransferase [Floricoccus tropicus]
MTNSVSSTSEKMFDIAAFFSGVGGIELGFEQTGKFRVVYANEFDKNAQITYKKNYPDVNLDERDIRDVKSSDVPKSDVIVGGFPCQAFSIAGYRKGFEDDRGDLFFELLRIIKSKKPQSIFIENVKNMVTHDHGNTFKIIREALTMNGYLIKWKVLNGKDYGNIPQNRERIYIVGFRNMESFEAFQFPDEIELTTSLSDVIDFKTPQDDLLYYKQGRQPFYDKLVNEIIDDNSIYQWRRQYVRENKSGVVPTLTANMGTGGHNVPLIKAVDGIRKLTPRETFNVQGYPSTFKLPSIANSHLYKQAGNSVVVPVIKRIAENIAKSLEISDSEYKAKLVDDGSFHIMHTKMNGKFEGESELIYIAKNEIDLENFRKENNIHFILENEYINGLSKNKKMDFYSYE